jgi:hypothetical protein
MSKRLANSLAAFVGWLLITVVGGPIHTGQGRSRKGRLTMKANA